MQTLSGGPNVATVLGCRVKGVGNGQTNFIRFFLFTSFAFNFISIISYQ